MDHVASGLTCNVCNPKPLCVFQIEEITFKNYYTAYVTVRLLRRLPGQDAPAKWCTVLRDLPLMDNPHTEQGSQDYYSLHRTQVYTADPTPVFSEQSSPEL